MGDLGHLDPFNCLLVGLIYYSSLHLQLILQGVAFKSSITSYYLFSSNQMHLFSVLPSSPQQNEKWFKTFEEAAFYAREIHLIVNRYVHIHRDGTCIRWMRV